MRLLKIMTVIKTEIGAAQENPTGKKKKSGAGDWINADFLSPDNTPRICLRYSFPEVE